MTVRQVRAGLCSACRIRPHEGTGRLAREYFGVAFVPRSALRNALLSGRLAVAIVRNMISGRLPPLPARTCFACGSNGFTRGNDLLRFHPFPL